MIQGVEMDKHIKHGHKVGPHIGLQSGLALFVVVMGLLFFIDATTGIQNLLSILTMLLGMFWFSAHHAYDEWHHHHRHWHR